MLTIARSITLALLCGVLAATAVGQAIAPLDALQPIELHEERDGREQIWRCVTHLAEVTRQ